MLVLDGVYRREGMGSLRLLLPYLSLMYFMCRAAVNSVPVAT
jgi:hypothetical protein